MRKLKPLSLAARTALVTLTVVMVCLALFGLVVANNLRNSLQRTTGEQQLAAVSFAAAAIESGLQERAQALSDVAGLMDPALMTDGVALQHFLESRMVLPTLFNGGAFFANPQGVAIASLPDRTLRLGISYIDRDYMVAALREGRQVISPPLNGKALKDQVFVIAVPVRAANGSVIGAFVGVTDLDKPNFLDAIGRQLYGKTGGFILVCRHPFEILSSWNDAQPLRATVSANTLPGQFGGGREGSAIHLDGAGIEVLSSVKSIERANWYLVAQQPTSEAFSAVDDMVKSMVLATLLFSGLAGALTWRYLRRQWSPVFVTVDELAKMAGPTASLQPLSAASGPEFAPLIQGVNRVLLTLEHREAALRDSETFRRSILDSVKAEIAVLDPQGVITAVNRPWLEIAERTQPGRGWDLATGSLGVNYLEALEFALGGADDVDPSEVISGIRAVIEGKQPSFSQDYACHRPHASRWLQMVVTPLHLAEGGVVVSRTDITDRVQAELARSESERRFIHFMRALPAAAHIKDEAGRYLYANPYSQRLLGDGNWYGKTSSDYYEPPISAQCERSDAEALALGTSTFEEDFRGIDGGIGRFQVNKFKIVRPNKPPLLGCVSLDITPLKKIQEELTVARANAEAANSAKSRFLAFASHDLRQPLSALSLFIHVLKGKIESGNQAVFSHIEASCNSLSALLTDLLDFSKLESGLVVPQPSHFAVHQFVRDLGDMYGVLAAQKGLQLRVRMNGLSALEAYTDASLLTRLVGNLLTNAVENTSSGGVLLALRHRQGKYWVEVWDSGSGIKAKQLDAIKDEFAQSHLEQTAGGSGLGLPMVSKTAALLGLKLRMGSRPGRGSLFAVELPVAQGLPPVFTSVAAVPQCALKIGLVDDHDNARLALAIALEAAGHKVFAASSGVQLLQTLGDQAPDLLMADHHLHGSETGMQCIQAVRSQFGEGLPAVIISGDSDPGLAGQFKAQGVELLLKPLQWAVVEAFLGKVTASQSGADSAAS
jgi:hypothetical protein